MINADWYVEVARTDRIGHALWSSLGMKNDGKKGVSACHGRHGCRN